MSEFWNTKYSSAEYIYGESPNAYLKQVIDGLPPGRLLVPGAGEGRDAVYGASRGWEVIAFDTSEEGRKKALGLAKKNGVEITYLLLDANDFNPKKNSFDLVALSFMHLSMPFRRDFHRALCSTLTRDGQLVLEAFSPKQIPLESGGPKGKELLFTASDLLEDFNCLRVIECRETRINLSEGTHHQGPAEVVRFWGVI